MATRAKNDKRPIVIVYVSGGVVQDVYIPKAAKVLVQIHDQDNIDGGDPEPEDDEYAYG